MSSESLQVPDGQSTPASQVRSNLHILVPVWATVFSGMFWFSSIRPFASKIADSLNTSVSMVGQTATVAMLAMAVAGLFSGPVADHIGHRRSLILGLCLMSIGAGLLSVSFNVVMVLAAGLLGGIGVSMTYGVALGVVATHFDGDDRRKALGIAQGFGSSATIVCAPILTLVATMSVWRGAHIFLMFTVLVAVFLVVRLLPRDTNRTAEPVSPAVVIRAYAPLWRNANSLRLFIASGLRGVLSLGVAVYLGSYYVDHYGMSLREVGLASAIEGVGLVAGSVVGGTWFARYRQRPIFAGGMITIGAGWLMVYTVHPMVFLAVATVVVTTFCIGFTMTVLTNLIAEQSPCAPATTMVLNISTIGFGASLGAAYGGLLLWAGGYTALGIGVIPFAIVPAMLVWNPVLAISGLKPRLSGLSGD